MRIYSKNIGYVPECVELPQDVIVLEYLSLMKGIKENKIIEDDTQIEQELKYWKYF